MIGKNMDLIEFAALVQKLRNAQNGFFKTRETAYLIEAKSLEKRVDAIIEEILNPGLFK